MNHMRNMGSAMESIYISDLEKFIKKKCSSSGHLTNGLPLETEVLTNRSRLKTSCKSS